MRRWMLMLSKIAFFAADLLYFIISTRYKSCLAFSVQRFISPSRNEYLKWQWGWEKQKVRYDAIVATFRDHGCFRICIYYNTWDKTWVRVRHSPLCEVWKWSKKRHEFELMYQVLKDKCIVISEEVHHPPSPDFMPISYAVNRSRADSWRGLSQTSKYVNSVTRVPVKMWRVKR